MWVQAMKFDKKILRGLVIALLGIGTLWIGGFLWLTKGSDWEQIELVIRGDSLIKSEVKGNVVTVTPEFLGYSYGVTETSGYANFKAEIQHSTGSARFQISMTRAAGVWKVTSVKKLYLLPNQ